MNTSLLNGFIFLGGAISGIFFLLFFRKILRKWRKKTKRIQLNDVFDQLNIILSHTFDFIYIKDTKSRFIVVDNRFLSTFRLSSVDQVIGKTDYDFYPPDMANKFRLDEQQVISSRKPIVGEIEKALDEQGNIIYLSTSKFPVISHKNEVIGVVGIGRDITNLKKFENSLVDANLQLNEVNLLLRTKQEHIFEQAEKLKVQAKELEFRNQQLHELVKTRDKFLSVIAHDLKNPVSLLSGFSELLYSRFTVLDDAKKLKYINSLISTSRNLTNLLENLLQWASMQMGGLRFVPEKINVINYLNENLTSFHEAMKKKEISLEVKFEIDDNLSIHADRQMLDFVLRNLLTNAIKFTPRNGHINICVFCNNSTLEFSVEDNGIGMEVASLAGIFEIGQNQSAQGTEGESGTGLGLALTRDFIKKNNGTVWCESSVGKGSKFYFNLPVYTE